jgi:hypothetical protein
MFQALHAVKHSFFSSCNFLGTVFVLRSGELSLDPCHGIAYMKCRQDILSLYKALKGPCFFLFD